MKKQKIQFLILVIIIVAALGVLLLLKHNNEKAVAEEEAQKQGIVLDEIDSTMVTAFSYYVNGEELSFEKIDDSWSCVQDRAQQIDADKISSVLANVCEITADEELLEVEDLGTYGLLEPSNTVTIVCGDKTICYEIGAANEIVGGYYVKKSDAPQVYLVSGSIATAFTDELASYIVEEEETVSENEAEERVENTVEEVTETTSENAVK